jgi:hypothetical protein
MWLLAHWWWDFSVSALLLAIPSNAYEEPCEDWSSATHSRLPVLVQDSRVQTRGCAQSGGFTQNLLWAYVHVIRMWVHILSLDDHRVNTTKEAVCLQVAVSERRWDEYWIWGYYSIQTLQQLCPLCWVHVVNGMVSGLLAYIMTDLSLSNFVVHLHQTVGQARGWLLFVILKGCRGEK